MISRNEIYKHVKQNMWKSIEIHMLPATSYGMLAVSAIWSLVFHFVTHRGFTFGYLTFGLFLATGIFGAWYYVNLYNKSVSSRIRRCFKISKFLNSLFSLPTIVCELYLRYHFSAEIICAHLLLPLLALVPYGTNVPIDKTLIHLKKYYPQNRVKDALDFVMFCNMVSMTIVSTLGGNLFGIAAAFVYAVMHFIITEEGYIECLKLPAEPFYISGMGVFCLLGMRAMMAACE